MTLHLISFRVIHFDSKPYMYIYLYNEIHSISILHGVRIHLSADCFLLYLKYSLCINFYPNSSLVQIIPYLYPLLRVLAFEIDSILKNEWLLALTVPKWHSRISVDVCLFHASMGVLCFSIDLY